MSIAKLIQKIISGARNLNLEG